jgi:hypothetical protein
MKLTLPYREGRGMNDLNLLVTFVAEKYGTFRFDLQNRFGSEGWRADIQNTYGFGPTPLMATIDLLSKLKLTEDDYKEWLRDHDPGTN